MFGFLSATIVAAAMGASGSAQAPASGVLEEWIVDNATARVARNDAFERGPDGVMLGDRILFDLRRRFGEERGTLVVSCLLGRFVIRVEGRHLLHEGSTADWPLAAKLAKNYCASLDDLPPAESLTPI